MSLAALGRSCSGPAASPTTVKHISKSCFVRASAYALARLPRALSPSASRCAHSSVNLFFRTRKENSCGQGTPRNRSIAFVRTVSSPVARTARSVIACGVRASAEAQKRVPISTPSAPSITAAASPRPSAIPPAAATSLAHASPDNPRLRGQEAASRGPLRGRQLPRPVPRWRRLRHRALGPHAARFALGRPAWPWRHEPWPREGLRVTKGKKHAVRRTLQHFIERLRRAIDRPGDETHAKLAALDEPKLLREVRLAAECSGVSAAQDSQAAGIGDRSDQAPA